MIGEIARLRMRGSAGIYIALSQCALVAAMASLFNEAGGMPWLGTLVVLPAIFPTIPLIGRRSVAFEAGLPIAGRDIVAAHALGALVFVWLPIATWLAVVIAQRQPASVLFRIGEVASILTAITLIPHVVRGGEIARPPAAALALAYAALAAVGAPISYFMTPAVGAAILLAGAAGMYVVATRMVPDALQVAPRARPDSPASNSNRVAGTWIVRESPVQWWRILLRGLTGSFAMWTVLMVMMGASNGWFLYIILGASSLADAARSRTRWLLAFPVSTHTRMLVTYVPVFVALIGGQALGSLAGRILPFGTEYVGKDAPRATERHFFPEHETEPSLEYWARASAGAGTVPRITAPWGETVAPDTLGILGMLLYDPYTITKASSPQFMHWQFQRVTTALYGHPVSEQDYDDHRDTLRRATSTGWRLAARWAGLVATLLFVLILSEIARSHALQATRGRRRLAMLAGLVPTFGIGGIDLYYQFARGVQVIAPLSRRVLLHTDLATPATRFAALAAAAAILASLFALLVRQFGASEIRSVDPRVARVMA